MKLNKILVDNTYLNNSYVNSYEIKYEYCTTQDIKYLNTYRDNLFNQIISNNGEIIYLQNCINKQQQIQELLIKCYNLIK